MGKLDITDAELPGLLAGSPKLILMLTTARFAAHPAYAGITFLQVDANGNPAARQRLGAHAPPVFAGYEQDRAVGDGALFTELLLLRAFLEAFWARP